jgi:predicted metallopeptidase
MEIIVNIHHIPHTINTAAQENKLYNFNLFKPYKAIICEETFKVTVNQLAHIKCLID